MAGPWPAFSPSTLPLRAVVAVVVLAVTFRSRFKHAWLVTVLVACVLMVEATAPRNRSLAKTAEGVGAAVAMQLEALVGVADDETLRDLLAPDGVEIAPEAAFDFAHRSLSRLTYAVDALVIVDGRGQPIAWAGTRAQLPARLRTLGERTVVAEPGVGETWLWWRAEIFEAGQPLGGLIAGVAVQELGQRSLLGVAAGRGWWLSLRDSGGEAIVTPAGRRLAGLEMFPTPFSLLQSPAVGLLLMCAVLAIGAPRAVWLGSAAVVFLVCWLGGLLAGGLAASVAVGLLGLVLAMTPRGWSRRIVGIASVVAVLAALPYIMDPRGAWDPAPGVVWPGMLRVVLAMSLTFLVWSAATSGAPLLPWLQACAWVPVIVGVFRGENVVTAVGMVAIVALGTSRRKILVAALLATATLSSTEDALRRRTLAASAEATLAAIESLEQPTREMLASLPDSTLAGLVDVSPNERQIRLGRLASRLGFERRVPGGSLAVLDDRGTAVAFWGEATVGSVPRVQPGFSRPLENGWQLAVVVPQPPNDLLVALTERGLKVPLGVYDRSGAVIGRGGNFRPLSPARVGAALAAERSWGSVGVGEREFPAYLRARRDDVLAVPWVRPPVPEGAVGLAALALWGVLPLAVASASHQWRRWWRQRRSFAGRLRVLLAATAVLPVVLLAQLLASQWALQRERARLELGRAMSRSLAAGQSGDSLLWVARELGAAAVVYRNGVLLSSTRPDLVSRGVIPGLPPAEAYIRSVRGWREPVVTGSRTTDVFASFREGQETLVVGVVGLPTEGAQRVPTPGEWFAVTGMYALMAALVAAQRLGWRLARPLRRLVGAARLLEWGRPVTPVATSGDEELAALGRAFSTMAAGVQRREDELRRQRDLLEGVLGTLSAAVVVIDASGEVQLANPAARALLDQESGLDALEKRFNPALAELLARARAGASGVVSCIPAGLPEALWRVSVVPLETEMGRILVVLEDLSELARAERLSSLAELARIVAHEVKNPLTPIRLWAEELQAALERGADDVVAVARTAAEQILGRVEHLREVAQGFSNLVALEHWEPVQVELKALAEEVAREYSVLEQRSIRVAVRGEPVLVSVDPRWMRRALRHLLENSARALGWRSGWIEIAVHGEDDTATISVDDSGGGVDEALLSRLFEPHFSTTEGTGLGLAVVRRVALRASGRVEARNSESGLQVLLHLPRPIR